MSRFTGTLKNIVIAIFKGELLLRLGVDRFFFHIVYVFALIVAAVWISLKVDVTLTKVEDNKNVIHDLEIYKAEFTGKLARTGRFSTVEKKLKELGSDVAVPEKPATKIKQ